MQLRPTSPRWALVAGCRALAGVAGAARLAIGSDHQDTPFVELNPKTDMTDVYAFPGSSAGRIALVMDTRAFLTPAGATDPAQASFDHNLLYQFKVDNNGDAKEDKVIQVSFTGEGADQQIEVRGPMAPPVRRRDAERNRRRDARGHRRAQHHPRHRRRHPGVRGPARRSLLHRSRGGLLHSARPPAGGRCALELLRPDAEPAGPPFFFRNPGVDYVAAST